MNEEWYKTLKGIAKLWGKRVYKGLATIDDVPEEWRDEVQAVMPVGE
jgi:hypothetical protein